MKMNDYTWELEAHYEWTTNPLDDPFSTLTPAEFIVDFTRAHQFLRPKSNGGESSVPKSPSGDS